MDIVAARLNDWKPDGVRGFEDCKRVFEAEHDRLTAVGSEPQFVASDALGIWIVGNILGHAPETSDECQLVRDAGALVTHAFFNWFNWIAE